MNTNMKFGAVTLTAVLLAGSGVAFAQVSGVRSAYAYPSQRDTGVVQLGTSPVWVAPWVSLGYGHDSNVTLSNTNEISSDAWQAKGGLKADARGEQSVFQFMLDANDLNYNDSEADNFTDFFTTTSLDVALSSRSFLRGYWDYSHGHDGRGATDRGIGSSVDKYSVSRPGFVFAYGAPTAPGRVEIYGSEAMLRYRNNYEVTESSERDTTEIGSAFYWRVSPRTSLVAEVRATDIEFLLASPNSSREMRYYAGAAWEATAATSGSVKVGRVERKLDGGQPKYTAPSWEAALYWSPRTYSKFDLYTSRYTTESTGLGDFIVSDATGVDWNHSWNSVFSTKANARFQKDKYQGFDRKDDVTTLGLGANYKFRRWMSVGAEYRYITRDSNTPENEYDRDIWLLSAEVSM
jgi:hypothetical protein